MKFRGIFPKIDFGGREKGERGLRVTKTIKSLNTKLCLCRMVLVLVHQIKFW